MAKLNEIKVLEMRSKARAGRTLESLALEYGISPNAARNAVRGLSYQNVEHIAGDPGEGEMEASQRRLLELMNSGPPAEPEEDPLEEMLRRRSGADALVAQVQHKAQNAQENEDEPIIEKDGG